MNYRKDTKTFSNEISQNFILKRFPNLVHTMSKGILVTAIGSFSSNAIVDSLNKLQKYNVYGSDIYPSNWHSVSLKYKKVFKVPRVTNELEYVDAILRICKDYAIEYIIPITDLEIDIYNLHRLEFEKENITLCISSKEMIDIARNKYLMSLFFKNNSFFKIIPTYRTLLDSIKSPVFPYIAKLINGRSSEGIIHINDMETLKYSLSKPDYIIQPFIKGDIYTVDYIRNSFTGSDFSLSRQELLRTSNGAGITVLMTNDKVLTKASSYIGEKIGVNGCVNFEFIKDSKNYYLMDINPRFSAGIAFSIIAGYDIVKNHLNCFMNKEIEKPIKYTEMIIAKSYTETIITAQKK